MKRIRALGGSSVTVFRGADYTMLRVPPGTSLSLAGVKRLIAVLKDEAARIERKERRWA